jgi:hypothetical protein
MTAEADGNTDDTMAKEKATMKARAPKDNVMTTQMLMRNKKFRMQFVVAEVIRMDMAGTKSWMQAVSAKGRMEEAGFAHASSEVARLRMAEAARSPSFTRRNFDKGKRQESKTDKSDGYPFHYSRTRLGGSEKSTFLPSRMPTIRLQRNPPNKFRLRRAEDRREPLSTIGLGSQRHNEKPQNTPCRSQPEQPFLDP